MSGNPRTCVIETKNGDVTINEDDFDSKKMKLKGAAKKAAPKKAAKKKAAKKKSK